MRWWLSINPRHLSKTVRRALDQGPEYLSVITYWQVMIKSMKDTLQVGDTRDWWRENPSRLGFVALLWCPEQVDQLPGLPTIHRDPFDRALIAQAIAQRLVCWPQTLRYLNTLPEDSNRSRRINLVSHSAAARISSTATPISALRVKLFADSADPANLLELARNSLIRGFTTNPTLMRKAGICDYRAFAQEILAAVPDRPISFEVFADEFDAMERQARLISAWGPNVYVKIPITNTRGESSCALLRQLAGDGMKLNVTGLLTLEQVCAAGRALAEGPSSCISVFAGRIADTGRDPVPIMATAVELLRPHPQIELIWASPRELLNLFQADAVGCHIITLTTDILKKLPLIGKDLTDYSLETVKMFYDDARASGFEL